MKDIKGVERGGCRDCSCNEFLSPHDGSARCSACGHPPARHQNLSSSGSQQRDNAGSDRKPSLDFTVAESASSRQSSSSLGRRASFPLSGRVPRAMAATPGFCAYPGCQEWTLFDPNTGEDFYYCAQHNSLADGS